MAKYYLAGPMSGLPYQNIPAFDAAAANLRSRGYTIVSPAELDEEEIREEALADVNGEIHVGNGDTVAGLTWGDFLSRDVKLIADDCDGIILLPDWEKSKGARLECFVALSCGYHMFEYRSEELWPINKEFALELIKRELVA